MIYPTDLEQRIGFDIVRNDIEAKVQTLVAKELLRSVAFSTDFEEIKLLNEETAQMLWLLHSIEGQEFPKRGYIDISGFLPKIRVIGGFIESTEMLQLATAIELCDTILSFFTAEESQEQYSRLRDISSGVSSHIDIAIEVRRIVDKFGNVTDNASPQLSEIRRSLISKKSQISRRLQQILAQAQSDGYADADSSLSIRDGRSVIPVAAGHKRKIKGFVFDESASGKTAYIEPIEVIELNNEVRELVSAERYEIVKILTSFADTLRPRVDELLEMGSFICYFDFLLAKAKYAQEIGAGLPLLSSKPEIDLKNARHPLLEKVFKGEGKSSELIPLDIRLTTQKPLLLISGPNAGGKSVCLKTVGLLQYMLQCGVLPSTDRGSTMGVFDSIFIDIGDQQSLDNDLSTYSSHLTNMKAMLKETTNRSLLLIDEFGGGTEPNVGGAIAESILKQFIERGVQGVITTHYANLKYFAASQPGIENGAMMFDVAKIKPLYRLEMGVAGNSYAFEIARKIGVPQSVLQDAAELIGDDKMSLEKQLRDAQRDKRYWENKRESIRVANKSAERTAAEYESELSEIQKERSRLIKEAKVEAAKIIKDANALIENTIREIKEAQAEKEKTQNIRKKVEQFRSEVQSEIVVDIDIERKIKLLKEREERRAQRSKERIEQKAAGPRIEKKPVVKQIEVGSMVVLDGGATRGKVLSINSKKAIVAFGMLSSTVELSRLKVTTATAPKSHRTIGALATLSPRAQNLKNESIKSSGGIAIEAAMSFTTQLDIRGMRAIEALDVIQRFVDEAIILGQKRVSILHGKGTGALREEARRYLRSEPMVARAYDEQEQFGGAGITIVEMEA